MGYLWLSKQLYSSFLDKWPTIEYSSISNDVIRLRLFSYTLWELARESLDTFSPHNIIIWNSLSKKLLNKFFSPKRIAKLRDEINTFSYLDSKCYYKVVKRYKTLFRQCPLHSLQTWLQVQYFYVGLNPNSRAQVESTREGSIARRTADQLYEIMEIWLLLVHYSRLRDWMKRDMRGCTRLTHWQKFQPKKVDDMKNNGTVNAVQALVKKDFFSNIIFRRSCDCYLGPKLSILDL